VVLARGGDHRSAPPHSFRVGNFVKQLQSRGQLTIGGRKCFGLLVSTMDAPARAYHLADSPPHAKFCFPDHGLTASEMSNLNVWAPTTHTAAAHVEMFNREMTRYRKSYGVWQRNEPKLGRLCTHRCVRIQEERQPKESTWTTWAAKEENEGMHGKPPWHLDERCAALFIIARLSMLESKAAK
jgi:hypothetical protein